MNIDDLLINDNIKNIIFNNYDKWNLLIYGPPGTGKTTLINSFIKNVNNVDKLLINVSEDRGVEVVRETIFKFINNASYYKNKYIILDEMDSLTIDAQNVLNSLINKYNNVKFMLVCNFVNYIIPSIVSKCLNIRINISYNKQLIDRCIWKLNNLHIFISKKSIDKVIEYYNCDIRKIFNFFSSLSILYSNSFIPISKVIDVLE